MNKRTLFSLCGLVSVVLVILLFSRSKLLRPTGKKAWLDAVKPPFIWTVVQMCIDVPIVQYRLPNMRCPKESVTLSDITAHTYRSMQPNKFAVVMPFIGKQIDKLIANLERWTTSEYRPGDKKKVPTDLIFFFNRRKTPALEEQLKDTLKRFKLRKYFESVLFMYASLSDEDDEYPVAASRMFYILHDNPQIRRDYAYYFYMEPDCLPIRSEWLDHIISLSFDRSRPFWSMGSVYRGSQLPLPKDRVHINGNAIYTTAEDYHLFLCRLLAQQFYVFDVDPFYYFFHHYEDQQKLLHNFVFSDFVMNMAMTNYSERELKLENPYTYLIHGGVNKDL
jgi:hypothetical protein